MKKRTKIILAGIIAFILVVAIIFLKNHMIVTSNGISISMSGSDGPTAVFIAGKFPGGEKNMTYTSITMEEAKDLQDKPEVLPDLEQTIYVYCRSGRRSKEAADKLVQMGYTNIIEIGGILDWTGVLEK